MALNSVITNAGAMVALQSLNKTNDMMDVTQKRISTGYRVADAKDDGAAFAVAQKVRGDISGLTSANEQLGGAKGLLDTTTASLTKISDTMKDVKAVMVKLADNNITGEDRKNYEAQYTKLSDSINNYIDDSKYNGKSLLGTAGTPAVEADPDAEPPVEAVPATPGDDVYVARNESATTYRIGAVDASSLKLSTLAEIRDTVDGGTATTEISAEMWQAALTGTDIAEDDARGGSAITAHTNSFAAVERSVNDALNQFGNDSKSIDGQISYNKVKLDAMESGLGALIDADLAKESARMQSLTIRQQLGTTSLSTANQAPSALLSLFR